MEQPKIVCLQFYVRLDSRLLSMSAYNIFFAHFIRLNHSKIVPTVMHIQFICNLNWYLVHLPIVCKFHNLCAVKWKLPVHYASSANSVHNRKHRFLFLFLLYFQFGRPIICLKLPVFQQQQLKKQHNYVYGKAILLSDSSAQMTHSLTYL